MYAVIRRYRDSAVIDAVAGRQGEVEAVIREVPGFVAYYIVRAGDGGASITVCADQAGTAELTRRAAEWVRQNVPGAAGGAAPEVTEGEVLFSF